MLDYPIPSVSRKVRCHDRAIEVAVRMFDVGSSDEGCRQCAESGIGQCYDHGDALTFGLVLVVSGWLGDALGWRQMFLVALTGFALTSAVCGAASSAELLVAARLMHGITADMLTPQNWRSWSHYSFACWLADCSCVFLDKA